MGIAYLRKSVWILKKFQATIFVLKKINIKKKVGFVFKIQTLFTKVLILLLLLQLVVINVLSLLRLCTVEIVLIKILLLMKWKNYRIISQQLGLKQTTKLQKI